LARNITKIIKIFVIGDDKVGIVHNGLIVQFLKACKHRRFWSSCLGLVWADVVQVSVEEFTVEGRRTFFFGNSIVCTPYVLRLTSVCTFSL